MKMQLTTPILLLAAASTTLAQQTDPLVSLLSVASNDLKSIESAYSTTDPAYESLLNMAATQVAQVTSSLANNPSRSAIEASLAAQYGTLLSNVVASATSSLHAAKTGGSVAGPAITGLLSSGGAPAAPTGVPAPGPMNGTIPAAPPPANGTMPAAPPANGSMPAPPMVNGSASGIATVATTSAARSSDPTGPATSINAAVTPAVGAGVGLVGLLGLAALL